MAATLTLAQEAIRAVAGLIIQDGKVLCVRSSRCPESLSFPGGKPDNGERPEETLIREFGEELGKVEIIGFDPSPAEFLGWGYKGDLVRLTCFLVTIRGEPVAHNEIQEIVWVERENIGKHQFTDVCWRCLTVLLLQGLI